MPPEIIIAPFQILTDERLTDPERRVLWALFSFRGKDTNIVWPSLESLAERALIKDTTRISKLTKSLSTKGWLTKKKRGFTGGNTYTLIVPSNLGGEPVKEEPKSLLNEPVTSSRKSPKLYLVTDGEAFKIGITTMPLAKRLGSLQTSSHKKLSVVFCAECEDASERETTILEDYKHQIISGEWLSLTGSQLEGIASYQESLSNLDWYANLAQDANSNLDRSTNSNLDQNTKYKEEFIEQSIEQTIKEESELEVPQPPAATRIPFEKIKDLYHATLPSHPRVAAMTDKRKGHIRQSWHGYLNSLEQWEAYFRDGVATSEFLTGRVTPQNNRRPFIADFDWLINQNNIVKVSEGKYHG